MRYINPFLPPRDYLTVWIIAWYPTNVYIKEHVLIHAFLFVNYFLYFMKPILDILYKANRYLLLRDFSSIFRKEYSP